MEDIQDLAPDFQSNLYAAQKFNDSKHNEAINLQRYFINQLTPYIESVISSHPNCTYEDLDRHLKIDMTEFFESIFHLAYIYDIYMESVACDYFLSHPSELDKYQKILKDNNFDDEYKIAKSEYNNTFNGVLLSYLLHLNEGFNDEYPDFVQGLGEDYQEYIAEQKRKGISDKDIYNNLLKKYKKEYDFKFVNLNRFSRNARIAIFGLPEYLKISKQDISEDLLEALRNSIVELNKQFDKFGEIDASREIRMTQFKKLGLEALASKMDENSYSRSSGLNGIVTALPVSTLLPYNIALANRYSKVANTLAEGMFLVYQYDYLNKFLDPDIQKTLQLKKKLDVHKETDETIIYSTDKDSEYPTKNDLFRALKAIYPIKSQYSALVSRISPLPEARKDASKVSIPGLIYELKEIFGTREEFERAMSKFEKFYPSINDINYALEKTSFLYAPTKMFVEDMQNKINVGEYEALAPLTEEEELDYFGNISPDKDGDIIRYSPSDYIEFMKSKYGEVYQKYFNNLADHYKAGKDLSSESANEESLPTSNIEENAKMYFKCFSPVFYSYEFKDELINSTISLISSENDLPNVGIILNPDSISKDGIHAKTDRFIGIGIDANLTYPVQVHAYKRNVIDFLQEYSKDGDTILPVYKGFEDFDSISTQDISPFSKNLIKYIKTINSTQTITSSPTSSEKTTLSPEASRYVAHLLGLATLSVPAHLKEDVSSPNKKKKKLVFNRDYIRLSTGELGKMIDGKFVPNTGAIQNNNRKDHSEDEGYEI